ncbi:MAG: acyloxyacyl hydrolase [Candidatus Algichlamydia australiensis]|nr:acyloxyacyl hydrolase [Chlamydiales bacterium]
MKKFLFLFLALPLFSDHPKLLMMGAGVFDVDRKHPLFQYQLEYRSDYEIFLSDPLFIRPLVGFMGTTKGALYLYTGIAFDVFLGKSLVFTPSFAPGLYYDGGGKSLGFPLEYRSTVELAYRTETEARIGFQFYHISNGSVGRKNPGTESLVFFLAFPL